MVRWLSHHKKLAFLRQIPHFLSEILVRIENHKQITENRPGLKFSKKSLFSLMVLGDGSILLAFRLEQGDADHLFSYL